MKYTLAESDDDEEDDKKNQIEEKVKTVENVNNG